MPNPPSGGAYVSQHSGTQLPPVLRLVPYQEEVMMLLALQSGLATMLTTHTGFWVSPAIHVSRLFSVSQSPEGLGYPDLSWTSHSQVKEKELEPQTRLASNKRGCCFVFETRSKRLHPG